MIAVGKKDRGKKRRYNEDAFFVSNDKFGPLPNLYVVADGMGGHKAGDHASELAIDVLGEFLTEHSMVDIDSDDNVIQLLKRAVAHTNYKIFIESQSNKDYEGMGTTLTMATIIENKIYIAHVGDSRLYIIDDSNIYQITQDHSYVQEMLSKGTISNKEAYAHPKRHIITRAVGTYEKVKVDTHICNIEDANYVFLCSDGITTMLTNQEIHEIIVSDYKLKEKVDKLIELANARGGNDNITVILAISNKVVK